MTENAIYAKLEPMRYLLSCLLFFLPLILSYAKDSDDPGIPMSSMRGTVTTRTGGSVTTRSYTPKSSSKGQSTKSRDTSKKKIKSKKKSKAKVKPEDQITDDSLRGVLAGEAKVYHEEGYKLQSNGDLRGALVYYKKATELDPSSVILLNDLGVVYEGLGDEVNAVNMYKKVVQVDPRYLPAYANLALFYEGKGDIKNATYYWQKRYELGKEGEYWREQAAQHLLKLGTYPQIKKDILNRQAEKFSDDLTEEREVKKTDNIEEAKLHYYIGSRLLIKRDYPGALKEFETALTLNPSDRELKEKILEAYKKTQKSYTKDKVLTDTQAALDNVRDEDFTTAESKLRSALSAVYRVAQEKK